MRLLALSLVIAVVLTGAPVAYAKTLGMVPANLVSHPVSTPTELRTSSHWRRQVGAWGENLAEETLRLRGFNDVRGIKSGGNNGIDRIAIKRGRDGIIRDVKFIEVKTSRGNRVTLGQTRYGGKQMSRKWLAANLKSMSRSGNPELKKLALEISRFRKATGMPIERMGEVMHVNNRTGKLAGYTADGSSLKYERSVERLLKQVQRRGKSPAAREWATSSLATWDQIKSSRMSSWLGQSTSQHGRSVAIANAGQSGRLVQRELLDRSRKLVMKGIIRRSAGPVAAIIAFSVDAKELYDTEYAYRSGAISLRQRNIRIATTGGGMAGAFAGAWTGGTAGACIGTLGGPFAEITVPACAFVGATIGGIGGYIGGSAVAGYGATAWYESVDSTIRDRFEQEWTVMPVQ